MPLQTDYVTSAELKSFMRITDAVDDTQITLAITAASRAVDQAANRMFGQDDPVVVRYYQAIPMTSSVESNGISSRVIDPFAGRWILDVDDISTTTGLIIKADDDDDGVFERTLTINTDFRLWPWNAGALSYPFERIVLTAGGTFPTHLRGIEITAKFGWTTPPTAIKNATLIQAQTILKGGRESPLGIAGSPEFGNELRLATKLHPIAAELVRPYVRIWGVT